MVSVVVIATSGGIGAWYYLMPGPARGSPKTDGPDFYGALAAVNQSVAGQPGGPWTLYAVWGIASPVPFAPNAIGWSSYNETVNACGAEFNGLTLWNGSIPLFNGSFDSGTAPFWQFGFFSNDSQGILIATDILGATRVYPEMSMSSPCANGTGLGFEPWDSARSFTPFPVNSPIMAQSAWEAVGQRWLTQIQPAYEAYVLGFGDWGSASPQGLIVRLARCGEVGFTSVQPVVDVILGPSGGWESYFNGTQGCGDVISLGPPPVYGSYELYFAPPEVSTTSGTSQVNQSFQVTYGNRTADSDAGGLVSWMTTLTLSDSAGQLLQPTPANCSSWVSTIADCHAAPTGWYAVLLSPLGAWLDSYPSQVSPRAWSIPNVALASNQCLVVVVPSSWDVTGDVLALNGTAAHAAVNGTAVL